MSTDPAAAQAEAQACARAAAAVDAAAGVRHRVAAVALDGWVGPARDAFETDLLRVQAEATDLAAELRLAAARAREAADRLGEAAAR